MKKKSKAALNLTRSKRKLSYPKLLALARCLCNLVERDLRRDR